MTAGDTPAGHGYDATGTPAVGTLDDDDFDYGSTPATTYRVLAIDVATNVVRFIVDGALPTDDALTLELGGHALASSDQIPIGIGGGRTWYWTVPAALDDLAAEFPLGSTATVCLRTDTQVCPLGRIVASELRVADDVSAEEGENLTFTVELSPASEVFAETVTVAWATSGGTATSGTDFSAGSGTLTFAPGVTEQTFTVATIEDMTDEGDETFTVTLSNATSAAISGATATGTIENDDWPPLAWSTTLTVGHDFLAFEHYGYYASVGSLSTDPYFRYRSATYVVERVTVTTGREVFFNLDRSGLPTEDVMTLEIDGHEFPFGDRKSESTDKTWVWDAPADLHDPATNFPVGSTVLVCLRTEGEVCRTPTPMLSVADVSAAEGEDLTFTARLSLPSTETVTVDWATSGGTAVSGTDFTEGMGTLTFEPGAREQTFTVSTTEDMTVEEDETFTVMLSNATVAISVATATGTIKNDDYPPLAWSTTLTVGNFSNVLFGYRPGTGSLSDDDFEFGSATYEVTNVGVYIDGREPDVTYVRLNVNLAGLPNILTLEIDGHQFPFDKTVRSTGTFWLWLAPTALHDPATNFPVGSTATVCLYTEGNACPTDGNAAPTFSSDATFDAAENQTVAGAVLATDSDAGDDVTGYEITGGADDAFFSIGATDGALTFDAAPNYEDAKDQDTGNTYVVVVTATSGAGEREKTATQTITVTVTDVDTEAPGKPDAPAVSAASVTSLTVTWTAPANAGPAITDYDYRHRTTSPEGAWTEVTGTTITTLSATIGSLAENTSYDVQVRATNDEGTGSWSDSGSGRTDANAAPTFSSDATFDAAENQTVAGTVLATDSDTGDDVTGYEITGGADDAFFSIGATDGALTFDAAPNYEDAKDQDTGNTYVVVVTATSGAGEREKTATQTITVTVTDVDTEAPGKPDAPAVSAASVTSLTVTWTAPANAGPAITDYDYRHRTTSPEGAWTEVTGTTITTLSATIGSLAENTSYDVQVRATNDEGTGSWSDSGSGRTDANAAPTFSSDATFDAAENQTVAGTVLATDSDTGDDVTGYEITGGADDAFFSIGATDGALTFDAAPNYEDAKDQDTGNTYVVVVTATSGAGEREKTATQTITVTVTDVDTEAPGKPDAPAVSAASVTSLTVTWTAPANAGPAITDYDYRHRTTSPEGAWTEVTGTTITTLSATIGSLAENTSYDVQVRATNDEGTGSWSDSGSGRTDANAAPTFSSDATFDAAENQTVAGTVLATDSDAGDDVTGYEITGGADDAFFSIGATDGALTFDAAPNYEDAKDQDTGNTYVVVVTATSGAGEREKTATQTITVTVTDVDTEAPGKPDAPAVSAASVTSLTVTWTAPANAGPAITDYDYRHRTTSPEGAWTEVTGTTITTLSATIGSLAENTSYDVQVRATNDEGTGSWSDSGSGRTDANAAPTFSSDATFDAAENQTVAGTVLATDSDAGDDVTGYEITGGADDAFFSIGATDGALTFDAAPNYEDAKDQDTGNTYVVVVTATSGAGEREKTATQTITVTVTDVDTEAPGKPDAPAVSAASVTSLTVTWTAPANAGPAITDYDVQYRAGNSGDWSDAGHAGTAVTATLTGLSENTSHQVQVRATNDEGTGDWSDSGSGRTDANAAPPPQDLQAEAGSSTSVTVTWSAPDGGPAITGYEVQYRAGESGSWSNWSHGGTATTATITGLEANTAYQVQVRALSAMGPSPWTALANVRTNTPPGPNSGICGRTPRVRDRILVLLKNRHSYKGDCSGVTGTHLAKLKSLDLGRNSSNESEFTMRLKEDDFQGLVNLERLYMRETGLESLPAGVFGGLAELEELELNENKLTSLPAGLFSDLRSLERLKLQQNPSLESLPYDEFEALPELTYLRVDLVGRRKLQVAGGEGDASLEVAAGGTVTYRVRLMATTNARAANPVKVTVSSDVTEVTVSPTTMSFTRENWFRSQEVTVSATASASGTTAKLTHGADGAYYAYDRWPLPGVTVRVVQSGQSGDAAGLTAGAMEQDRAARLCFALAGGDGANPAAVAAALWEDGDMSEDRRAALDSLGNGNGSYDLGDLLAWMNRCRRGEGPGPAADGAEPPSPPPALPASRREGGASRRRRGARGPARRRRFPGPPAAGSRTQRSGWLRTALLAALVSAWGCGDGIVGPRADAPRHDGPIAAVVDAGPLHVRLTAPAGARDIGAMLVVEGPAIDSVQAPGLEIFETDDSSSTRREIVIAGALAPDAPVLRIWVPHRGDEARYRVSLLQVAGRDFTLRDLTAYGTAISR